MCDDDNPGHIKAPSATQVHGTILAGVAVGVVALLLLFRFAAVSNGPFVADVIGSATEADGALQVVVSVANHGGDAAIATCRVTRDGTPRPDDLVFRTDRIPPGGASEATRVLPAPDAGGTAYVPDHITVSCV